MKSWVKALLIGLSITFTSLILLVIFLPSLLKPTLNRWLPVALDSFGISGSSIEINNFSWRRLDIQSLSVPLPDGSLISLQDLQLNYSPGQLIRGQLDTLSLQKLVLNIAGDSGKKIAGAAAVGARQAANKALTESTEIEIPAFKQWLSLPLNSLRIDQIELQHPTVAAKLEADITPQLWRIHGETQLDNIPLPWQLEIRLQQNGELLLFVKESQQLLTQLHANIDQDADGNTNIRLSNVADLQAISERLLVDIAPMLPFSNASLSSEITLPPRFQFPQGMDISTTAQVNTRPGQLLLNEATNNTPAQSLDWQGGGLKLTLNKQRNKMLQAEVVSHHQLLISAGERQLELQQLQDQQQQTTLALQCESDLSQCDISGVLAWQAQAFSAERKKPAQQTAALSLVPEIHWQQSSGVSGSLAIHFDGEQKQSELPQGKISSTGQFNFSADNNGSWQLRSEHGLMNTLTVTPLVLPGDEQKTTQNLQLSVLKFAALKQLSVSNNAGDWSFDPLTLQLEPFSAELNQSLAAGDNNVARIFIGANTLSCLPEISDNQKHSVIDVDCQLSLSLLPSSYQQWPIPDLQLTGPLTVQVKPQAEPETKQIEISCELDLAAANQQLNIRTRVQHLQGEQTKGSLQWQLQDAPLNWSSLGLGEMVDLTQLQLLSGSVSGQGWLDWQQQQNRMQLKPDFMLRFDGLSATYDNSVSLEGWRGLFAVRRPVDFDTSQPGDFIIDAQVAGDSLNSGVQLSNILARSQSRVPQDFSGALIEVYEMHTDVLGGRVHTPLIRFDTNKDINAFGIELENIQLSELAKLEPNAQVEATGVLDGVLPIVLTPEGPQVPGGTLFARAPGGVIRYNNSTSQALKSSDQTVGLAMQLLEDYHYQQLQSGVEYQPDGSLNLALQFQGSNPEFFDGQASHLNVNLDYNLLDLLESLRVSNDVIRNVEEKYQP